jgi:hypothetical protein
MKVLMLRNPSDSLGCNLREGETGQVSQALGERLVQLGIAVVVDEPEKPQRQSRPRQVRGVQDKPAIAGESQVKKGEIVQLPPEMKVAQEGDSNDE